ncbi:hypothetical protein SAMN05443668_11022 [Cryptosporangium aurantiacum]|uniref:Uncharacterized protein n=1 Tax=Cryptosporangium aurantiacum TaxID=134849 RepID=A0A1M7RCJ9_9ACTN|nr:hypothetical protein SAMN05443668_11022 [Cryptosporangium aurantiacum]
MRAFGSTDFEEDEDTMTAVSAPLAPTEAPDHRAGLRMRALAVVAGGVLFALGNALHPWEHNEAALTYPTWVLSHLTFAAGALLIAAGSGALAQRLAPSRVALVGLGLLWLGMVLMPVGAYAEAYVAPAVDQDVFAGIEESAAILNVVYALPVLLGPLLIAFGTLRHRLLPVWVSLALQGTLIGAVLGPALPKEGYGIIPGTVVFGFAIAAAGWAARR